MLTCRQVLLISCNHICLLRDLFMNISRGLACLKWQCLMAAVQKTDLWQVNEEKASLESRLVTEQEYLDNQLQKKVYWLSLPTALPSQCMSNVKPVPSQQPTFTWKQKAFRTYHGLEQGMTILSWLWPAQTKPMHRPCL